MPNFTQEQLQMVNAGGTALYVTPFGGRDGRLATNPIAIATPTREDQPILLDITSSVVAQGKMGCPKSRGIYTDRLAHERGSDYRRIARRFKPRAR